MNNRLTTADRDELRDDLTEAQYHLNDAIRLIENYVRRTDDRNAEAYLLDHLHIFAGRNHGFLTSDLNIDDLIERLDDYEDEENGENDEEDAGDAPEPVIRAASGYNLYWCNSAGRYVSVPDDED